LIRKNGYNWALSYPFFTDFSEWGGEFSGRFRDIRTVFKKKTKTLESFIRFDCEFL